jgi:predicted phage-related endonuclease
LSEPTTFVIELKNYYNEILDKYVSIGNTIKENDVTMKKIEEDIDNHIEKFNPTVTQKINIFYYLEGSSGKGKTQLAFAFKRKVLYVPLGI